MSPHSSALYDPLFSCATFPESCWTSFWVTSTLKSWSCCEWSTSSGKQRSRRYAIWLGHWFYQPVAKWSQCGIFATLAPPSSIFQTKIMNNTNRWPCSFNNYFPMCNILPSICVTTVVIMIPFKLCSQYWNNGNWSHLSLMSILDTSSLPNQLMCMTASTRCTAWNTFRLFASTWPIHCWLPRSADWNDSRMNHRMNLMRFFILATLALTCGTMHR